MSRKEWDRDIGYDTKEAKRKRRRRSKKSAEFVEHLQQLDRVDYSHDQRSLTAKIMGDPLPGRSALEQRETRKDDAKEDNRAEKIRGPR